MVIDNRIVGYELKEILKRDFDIKLIFRDPQNGQQYYFIFEGLFFETPFPVLNKKVERIELSDDVGFKARTQLVYLGYNPLDFKELLIKMSGSTVEYKSELICAFRHYQFTPA
jgi:hypothetical protein